MKSYEIDHSLIPEIVALTRKNGLRITCTFVVDENIILYLEDPEKFYPDPAYRAVRPEVLSRWKTRGRIVNLKGQEGWRRERIQPFLFELTMALKEAGVPIILGTDAKTDSMIPGYYVHRELEILTEAGFTPFEALSKGTINAARIAKDMKDDYKWGSVSPGNRADLLLLNKNPLDNIDVVLWHPVFL